MLSTAALATVLALSFPSSAELAAGTPSAAVQASPDLASFFPIATESITIRVDPKDDSASMTLLQMLDEFTRVTGVTLQMTRESVGVLKQSRTGLNRTLQVPATEVVRIVETLLIANDFVFLRLSNKEPRIWTVQSLQAAGGRGGPQVRNEAVMVDEAELALWADHPATLVTTTISLPKTDVRTLSNSMRTMFTDANTQQIIPVGQSSLVITGFAPSVAAIARMLHRIDDLAVIDGVGQPGTVPARPGSTGR